MSVNGLFQTARSHRSGTNHAPLTLSVNVLFQKPPAVTENSSGSSRGLPRTPARCGTACSPQTPRSVVAGRSACSPRHLRLDPQGSTARPTAAPTVCFDEQGAGVLLHVRGLKLRIAQTCPEPPECREACRAPIGHGVDTGWSGVCGVEPSWAGAGVGSSRIAVAGDGRLEYVLSHLRDG